MYHESYLHLDRLSWGKSQAQTLTAQEVKPISSFLWPLQSPAAWDSSPEALQAEVESSEPAGDFALLSMSASAARPLGGGWQVKEKPGLFGLLFKSWSPCFRAGFTVRARACVLRMVAEGEGRGQRRVLSFPAPFLPETHRMREKVKKRHKKRNKMATKIQINTQIKG